jgi:hypothetical protein
LKCPIDILCIDLLNKDLYLDIFDYINLYFVNSLLKILAEKPKEYISSLQVLV